MRFVESIKRRLLARLIRAIDETKARSTAFAGDCELAPGAQILSEGVVENFTGIASRVSVGANSFIRGRLLTYAHGGHITIGEWCYIGTRTEIWSMERVEIGNRVLISHNVNIHDGTAHSIDARERHAHFKHIIIKGHPSRKDELPGVSASPIIIEDDVWISFGVTILRGVRIGRGSVISAGSIVTKDVPPNTIYRNQVTPVLVPIAGSGDAPNGTHTAAE